MRALTLASILALSSPALAGDLQQEVATLAAQVYSAQPALRGTFARLQGLNPEHYLQRRRPEPEVGRELVRAKLPVAILADELLQGSTQLQAAERAALDTGLAIALSKDASPLAVRTLVAVLNDAARPQSLRETAADVLGDTRQVEAEAALTRLLAGGNAALGLRNAALRGLASVRSATALELLLTHARSPSELQAQAVSSLAVYGSAWAWATIDRDAGKRARERIEPELRTLVQTSRDPDIKSRAERALVSLSKR